jgi:hypothetical protein
MTLDVAFFKKGETVFDGFYPLGYVLMVFPGARRPSPECRVRCLSNARRAAA